MQHSKKLRICISCNGLSAILWKPLDQEPHGWTRKKIWDNAFPYSIQNNNPRVQKNPIMGIFWTFSMLIVCIHRYICHCQKFSYNYFPLWPINGTGLLDYMVRCVFRLMSILRKLFDIFDGVFCLLLPWGTWHGVTDPCPGSP